MRDLSNLLIRIRLAGVNDEIVVYLGVVELPFIAHEAVVLLHHWYCDGGFIPRSCLLLIV